MKIKIVINKRLLILKKKKKMWYHVDKPYILYIHFQGLETEKNY